MQTFLPESNFKDSLASLDKKRLGKQRIETAQIIIDLIAEKRERPTSRWINHPAVRMWADNIPSLVIYYNCCIDEWISRGCNNTMQKLEFSNNPPHNFDYQKGDYQEFSFGKKMHIIPFYHHSECIPPWYLGNVDFMNSHRSNLLRKDKEYYSIFGWDVPDNLPYLWPVNETKKFRTT